MENNFCIRTAAFGAGCFPNAHFKGRLLTLMVAGLLGWGDLMAQFAVIQSPTQGASCNFSLITPCLKQNPLYTDPAFYNIFWIFGNGEYAPYLSSNPAVHFTWDNYLMSISGISGTGSNITSSITYNYPPPFNNPWPYNFTYKPVAIPLPRKGDPPPPPPPLTSKKDAYLPKTLVPNGITVNAPTGRFVATPRTSNIPLGKKIYLAHSHGYLNFHQYSPDQGGEKSVFVISYKPPECMNRAIGRVHLYFSATRVGATGPIDPTKPNHLWFSKSYDPFYYSGQAADFHPFTPNPQSLFHGALGFEFFPNYTTEVRKAILPYEEFRLFEEVQFEDTTPVVAPAIPTRPTLAAGDWSYALALLTSSVPCDSVDPNIKPYLQDLDGYGEDTQGRYKLFNEYIVDADTIYLKSGEPHDPNYIAITNFCRDYSTVTLTLKFCNMPPATAAATGADVQFDFIDPNFEWCRQMGIKDQGNQPVNSKSLKSYFGKNIDKDYSYNCQNHAFQINNLNLDINKCASITVILKAKSNILLDSTTGVGIDIIDYLSKYPILKGSVHFHNTNETIKVQNDLFSDKGKIGSECIQVRCESFCIPFWYQVVAGFAILVLGVIAWKKFTKSSITLVS